MPILEFPEVISARPIGYYVEKVMSGLILPGETDNSNVIDPVVRHIMSSGEAGPIMAHACFVFQMGDWRRRRRIAEAENNYLALDSLDREFELIGLP